MSKKLDELRERIKNEVGGLEEAAYQEHLELSRELSSLEERRLRLIIPPFSVLMLISIITLYFAQTLTWYLAVCIALCCVALIGLGMSTRLRNIKKRNAVSKATLRGIYQALEKVGIDISLLPKRPDLNSPETWEAINAQLRGNLLSPADAPESDLLRPAAQPDTTPVAQLLHAPSE